LGFSLFVYWFQECKTKIHKGNICLLVHECATRVIFFFWEY
jgi:hypothetical protein